MTLDTQWGWQTLARDGVVHCVPANDTHVHLWCNCPCHPESDEETEIMMHNSFDGREDFERGVRKVS